MVALVAADNSVDTLKESMSRKENLGAVEVCDGIGMNLMRRKTKMSSRTMLKKIWSSSIFTRPILQMGRVYKLKWTVSVCLFVRHHFNFSTEDPF